MSVLMYDSIESSSLPHSAQAVAGYVDGFWPSFGAIAHEFYPRAHCLSITVHGNDAACCDCERGDLTVDQAVQWVERMLAKGVWRPCVYASQDTWENQGLKAQLAHYGNRIRRWIAAYPGSGGNVPPGYDAHQYTDRGPHGENYDISVCRDDFFPAAKPKPKPSPKPKPKITAAAIVGGITTGIQALLHAKGIAHWTPTPEEASVITLAAALLAGYIKKG